MVGLDEAALHRECVLVGSRHLDGAGRQEPVTVGDAPADKPGELDRHDLAAKEREQPADGPREPCVAAAPALGLGPLDTLDDPCEQSGKDLDRRDTLLLDRRVDVGAVLVVDDRQRLDGDALAARETLGGLGRRAVLGERRLDRRSLRGVDCVVLLLRKPVTSMTRRRGEPIDANLVVLEPRGVERLGNGHLQLLERAVQRAGRQLLDADLKDEVASHQRSPPSVSGSSTPSASSSACSAGVTSSR